MIRGFLTETSTINNYMRLKSYLGTTFGATRIWLGQYKSYSQDKELFKLFNIKYAFVSEDLKQITVAGNDPFNPLGKLKGSVELVKNEVIPLELLMRFIKLSYSVKVKSNMNSGWYHSYFEGETSSDGILCLLEFCGYKIVVAENVIGHNAISVNVLTHNAVIGEKSVFSANSHARTTLLGERIPLDELIDHICHANDIERDAYATIISKAPKLKILPSYNVHVTPEQRDYLKQRLKGLKFNCYFGYVCGASIYDIFIDLHHKKVINGVWNFSDTHLISFDNLIKLIDSV